MKTKRIAAICAICVIIALSLTLFAAIADAQDSSGAKSTDKSVGQKRGVGGALTTRADDTKDDDTDGPSKLQMGVGVGSIFVMIGVMKYL